MGERMLRAKSPAAALGQRLASPSQSLSGNLESVPGPQTSLGQRMADPAMTFGTEFAENLAQGKGTGVWR